MDKESAALGAEVARLRDIAAKYRRLADHMIDSAGIASARQVAEEYEVEADALERADVKTYEVPNSVDAPATTERLPTPSVACLLEPLLLRQPVKGPWALALALAVVAVPTLIRSSVAGSVFGSVFLPYVPFVVLSAYLLKPWHAFALAIASASVADFYFMPPHFQFAAAPSDIFGIGAFLACSGMVICFANTAKQFAENAMRMRLA